MPEAGWHQGGLSPRVQQESLFLLADWQTETAASAAVFVFMEPKPISAQWAFTADPIGHTRYSSLYHVAHSRKAGKVAAALTMRSEVNDENRPSTPSN